MSVTGDDLRAMFNRHAGDLIGYFARRVHDAELSRDLLAETFLTAFDSRERCRAKCERQRTAWLYGIAALKLKEHTRHAARESRALRRLGVPQALTPLDYERIEQRAAERELHRSVGDELARLSKGQQQAIQLRVIDERSYSEVAGDLGVSEQAARARVTRGMAILRRAIRPLRADAR